MAIRLNLVSICECCLEGSDIAAYGKWYLKLYALLHGSLWLFINACMKLQQ